MRKAQIQAQIFVYILMIVIVALVLVYGYKAIADFGKKSQQIDLIESKAMIKNAIEKNSGYRVIKKVDVTLPSAFTYICFVSSALVREGNNNIPSLSAVDYPVIYDSVGSKYNRNMFFFPDGTESMDVGEIEVDGGFLCFRKVNGIVTLRLEGQGGSVKVKEWLG